MDPKCLTASTVFLPLGTLIRESVLIVFPSFAHAMQFQKLVQSYCPNRPPTLTLAQPEPLSPSATLPGISQ
jgi:hypothetical protein